MNAVTSPVASQEENPRRFLLKFLLADAIARGAASAALWPIYPVAGMLCLAGAMVSFALYLVGRRLRGTSPLIITLGFTWSLFFIAHMRIFGWEAGFQQHTSFLVFAVFLFEHLPLRSRLLMALTPIPTIVALKFLLRLWEPIYPLSDIALDYFNLVNLLYAILTCGSVLLYFALTAARRQRELAAQLESRKQMLADLSHELKTPLAAMLARTQLEQACPEEQQRDERTANAFAMIERNLQGMRRLAKLMLDLTGLENGTPNPPRTPVDPAAIAGECVELLQPRAAKEQVTLSLSMPPGRMVLADADLLRAVLTNLLTNAIRHSEAGGEVIIQGGHEEDQQAGPQGFLLTVTDEGTGIPPEVLPHIFEPFYRGDQGRSRGEKVHHGLGLSIAQRATERMGGTLSVTSKLHEGSTFIIRL